MHLLLIWWVLIESVLSSHVAMETQPKFPIPDDIAYYGSTALIAIGLILSLGSFFR